MLPFPECDSLPDQYPISKQITTFDIGEPVWSNVYWCPNCQNGKTWDFITEMCDDCDSIVPDCKRCDNGGKCVDCGDELILSKDRYFCSKPIENCIDESKDYGIEKVDSLFGEAEAWMCNNCIQGLFWGANEFG
jgi:hypothetical protein